MSPLREAAVQLHELYSELKAAGFSRTESMELVTKMLLSTMNNQDGGSGGVS